jgi:hypothetical protein
LIHLRNGKVKHAFGLEESPKFPDGEGEKMVKELNAELAYRTEGGSAKLPTPVD